MESCLASSFQQNYPKFELIFCLESDSDPAIDVVTELIKQYPSVDAKIMISDEKYGPNPKINNLAKGFSAAKYDIIWVLDSNVWVSQGTLKRSVDRFNSNPKIALVHHLPLCVSIDGTSRGSNLDEMFMLSSHSKFYTAINFVGIAPCVMGKSNLYRRSVLDKAVSVKLLKSIEPGTGIRHFAQFIAEDNMIAQCIWDNGGRTALTAAETKPTTSPSSQPSPEPTTSSTSQPSPEPTTSSTSQSSSEPTPAPESTSEPTSSSQPQSTTTQSSSPSTSSTPSEGEFSGDGTFYNTGLGACGIESNDSQFVVAVGYELYDSVNTANPNNNPLCGRKITVFRGLKSVQVTVVDKCPGCSYYSLDLSPAAFDVLGNPDEGRIPITWIWS
ncbi:hypothetical protein DV113_002030 [Geotrichum candidum]|nr:hypothetical protein DV113_002030 [Geotrichum candidum]